MLRFTANTTPETIIRDQFAKLCPDGVYPMTLKGSDARTYAAYDWSAEGTWIELELDCDDLCAFLAWCAEESVIYPDDNAYSLRSSILTTLEIEEI